MDSLLFWRPMLCVIRSLVSTTLLAVCGNFASAYFRVNEVQTFVFNIALQSVNIIALGWQLMVIIWNIWVLTTIAARIRLRQRPSRSTDTVTEHGGWTDFGTLHQFRIFLIVSV